MSEERNPDCISQLLKLNSDTNLHYIEMNCKIADLLVYRKVFEEKLAEIKIEVEKTEIERKYLTELRETRKQFYEVVKLLDERTDELAEANLERAELITDILDMKKQKALEMDKTFKMLDKKRIEVYEQSKRIFERKPIIIKRNKMRNLVKRQKFDIAYMKQKNSDLRKVYANLQEMQKKFDQQKMIKFAQTMVKYYKKQKEQKQMLLNKQNLNVVKNTQERNNLSENIQETTELPKKLKVSSFTSSTRYDYINKMQLSTTQICHNIETSTLNMKPIELVPLKLNYKFDLSKYSNVSSLSDIMKNSKISEKSTTSKFGYNFENLTSSTVNVETISTNRNTQNQETTTQKSHNIETPTLNIKPTELLPLKLNNKVDPSKYLNTSYVSDILKNSKASDKSTISKFGHNSKNLSSSTVNLDTISTNTNTQNQEKTVEQYEKKRELKRKAEYEESPSTQQITKIKINQNTEIDTTTEKEKRIFISQPNDATSSEHNNSIMSLSQDSQKSLMKNSSQMKTLRKCIPKTTINIDDSFNLNSHAIKKSHNIPKIHSIKTITSENISQQKFNFQTSLKETGESQPLKQNLMEYNQIPQMFNLPVKVPVSSATNEIQIPADHNKQSFSLNPMFNLQATIPNVAKNVQLMSPKPFVTNTKSPYFVSQTQDDQTSFNTSAEQSDKVVNISSDQPLSPISGSAISEEYFDASTNQQTGIEGTNKRIPMDFNNEGFNAMEYYEENNTDFGMTQDLDNQFIISPPGETNIPGYMSPPEDQNLQTNNSRIPASTSNNLFGAGQNNGNNFFNFSQSSSKPGNIFNMW